MKLIVCSPDETHKTLFDHFSSFELLQIYLLYKINFLDHFGDKLLDALPKFEDTQLESWNMAGRYNAQGEN